MENNKKPKYQNPIEYPEGLAYVNSIVIQRNGVVRLVKPQKKGVVRNKGTKEQN
jgi:hypothetical protein